MSILKGPALASALLVALTSAHAQAEKITLIQAHNNIVVGEEVFLHAVPQKLGYFAEEGLEVTIVGAAGGTMAVQALQGGSADFASTQPEIVMKLREQGGEAVVIYNLKTRGSYAIAVPEGSDIASLEDLKGKVLGVASLASGAIPVIVESLKEVGVGDTDVTMVAAGTGAQAATALSSGQVDALGLWDSAYGAIENTGQKLSYIELPLVTKLASFALATTETIIREKPEAIEAYCRAIAKGWHFTLTNPEAAIRIFHEVFPETRNASVEPEQAVAQDSHVLNMWLANGAAGQREGFGYGYNYPDLWEFSAKYFIDQGMLEGRVAIEDAYTNQFIDGCNDFDREAVAAAALNYK